MPRFQTRLVLHERMGTLRLMSSKAAFVAESLVVTTGKDDLMAKALGTEIVEFVSNGIPDGDYIDDCVLFVGEGGVITEEGTVQRILVVMNLP